MISYHQLSLLRVFKNLYGNNHIYSYDTIALFYDSKSIQPILTTSTITQNLIQY